MAGLESNNNLKEKPLSSYPDINKGKLEVGNFYNSIEQYCNDIVDEKLFESIAHIETVYGTQDARSGACKGVVQINPVVMSSDLIARPHYYGITLNK